MKVKESGNFRWQETSLRLARWLVFGFAIFQICLPLVGIEKSPGYLNVQDTLHPESRSWAALPLDKRIAFHGAENERAE